MLSVTGNGWKERSGYTHVGGEHRNKSSGLFNFSSARGEEKGGFCACKSNPEARTAANRGQKKVQ